ncbi:MAG: CBS domain-containing protein [Alphaproteobacteria bacterium]|nr:CBS domain-containing protein [Alphaproteobacteria bacterium]
MQASDIMTKAVTAVPPDMPVQEIARLMGDKRISGVPVVAPGGHVLGMVSESDLLHRVEIGTLSGPANWTDVYTKPDEMAREFAKSHGRKAHDIMAKPVVSVQHDAELQAVAETLDHHHIKRAPVMKDGKLVGIISRSDLVRALSRTHGAPAGSVHLGDGIILKSISDAMRALPWIDSSYINMTVKDGIVFVRGYVQSKEHQDAVRVLIEELPGVERVETQLEVGLPTLSWDGQMMRNHMLM